jgi:putative NADPH-quinone reductase
MTRSTEALPPACTTLVLVFHPDLARSRANAALAAAARRVPGTTVVDMQLQNPDGRFDTAAEAARLLTARHVVLQFPVQWYSTPALLKAWQDAVLTRMVYMAWETEGRHLAGRALTVVATAGNSADAYAPGGANRFTMDEILRPLEATAHRCGLAWRTPLVVFRAQRLEQADMAAVEAGYVAMLAADAPVVA